MDIPLLQARQILLGHHASLRDKTCFSRTQLRDPRAIRVLSHSKNKNAHLSISGTFWPSCNKLKIGERGRSCILCAWSATEESIGMGPSEPTSKVGKFLAGLMRSSPQLFVSAVIRQLENLEKDTEEMSLEIPPLFEDDILWELENRIRDLRAREQHVERQRTVDDLLYLCVVMCFHDLGILMTPNLHLNDITHLLASAHVDVEKLLSTHNTEAAELIKGYLHRVTLDTEAMAIGRYQMRMPPMLPNVAIAIPFIFLSQLYKSSLLFGYSLRRAQQVQKLDASLSTLSQSLPIFEVDGSDIKPRQQTTIQTQVADSQSSTLPLHSYLYLCTWESSYKEPFELHFSNNVVEHVCERQTEALFGDFEQLQVQVETALYGATSVEDAQLMLDEAMRTSTMAWQNISLVGIERLMLEAVTFGRILWDVEQTFDIEYHLV